MPFKFAPSFQISSLRNKLPSLASLSFSRVRLRRLIPGLALALAATYIAYDKLLVTEIELIYSQGGPATGWIQALGDSVTGKYSQSPQLPMRFLEIIYGNVIDKRLYCDYDREVLHLKDGENIALDWLRAKTPGTRKPVAVLIPGLTGCSTARYIKYSNQSASRWTGGLRFRRCGVQPSRQRHPPENHQYLRLL
jgi:hypothetical protein